MATIDAKSFISKFLQGSSLKREKNKLIKEWSKKNGPKVLAQLETTILAGNSPVISFRRFPQYSKSYKEQINGKLTFIKRNGKTIPIKIGKKSKFKQSKDLKNKKIRPVNLKLTGKMLKSLRWKYVKEGFAVYFKDKKAKWHNEGEGNLPVRRIMPEGQQRFKRVITKVVEYDAREGLKKIFKDLQKLNR